MSDEDDDHRDSEPDEDDDHRDSEPDEDPFQYLDDEFEGRETDPFDELDADATASDDDPGFTEESDDSDGGSDAPDSEWGAADSTPGVTGDRSEGADRDDGTEGDPFLDTGGVESGEGGEPSPTMGGDPSADPSVETGAPDSDPDTDPLAGVDVPTGDPFEDSDVGGGSSEFDAAGVSEIDSDAVWEQFVDVQSRDARLDREEETTDVSKHDFCETCPHFSPPPEIHCSHEGTEILEFLDMETVRVVDCPIVAERRELGGIE
jgi:hypothetical protein